MDSCTEIPIWAPRCSDWVKDKQVTQARPLSVMRLHCGTSVGAVAVKSSLIQTDLKLSRWNQELPGATKTKEMGLILNSMQRVAEARGKREAECWWDLKALDLLRLKLTLALDFSALWTNKYTFLFVSVSIVWSEGILTPIESSWAAAACTVEELLFNLVSDCKFLALKVWGGLGRGDRLWNESAVRKFTSKKNEKKARER